MKFFALAVVAIIGVAAFKVGGVVFDNMLTTDSETQSSLKNLFGLGWMFLTGMSFAFWAAIAPRIFK